MTEIAKNIRLDFTNPGQHPRIDITQYSSLSYTIVAELYNGDEEYTIPSGTKVYARLHKPSGTIVYEAVTSFEGNIITYKMRAQTTSAPGSGELTFELKDDTGNLRTPRSIVTFHKDAIQDGDFVDETSNTGELSETIAAYSDASYHQKALAVTSVAEMDSLFVEWWKLAVQLNPSATKSQLLERWFGTVLDDDRVHGVKFPLFSTSETAIGELTDDSAGLTCTPSTEATAGQDDFAYLPQFWCLDVAAEKNADGSHVIYAVEHIDSDSAVHGGTHLCWVLQKNTYTREWDADGYRYFKMRSHPASGYTSWPQGTDRTGKTYAYMGNPKYYAGLDADGLVTCGTGLAPVNFTSHNAGVALWRKRGSQYSGASGNLLKFQLAMIWLKYARKGNSGTIEGCTSYNYQYTAAVTESGVKRVLLTEAQAANLLVGSCVEVGVKDTSATEPTSRGTASMYSLAKSKRIKSITSVTVDGTTYKAVNIDTDTSFDTTAGETYISTMPYYSGWNDTVQGFDGSRYSYTNGHEPGLIQKTEFMVGMYIILSDELWQWSQDDAGDDCFDCYICDDQSKVTTNGSVSSDYEKQEDLTLVFAPGLSDAWWYIEDTAITRKTVWPASVSQTAGTGTGCKAGFYEAERTSGIRAAWCCGDLSYGSGAGLPARASIRTAATSYWSGGCGSPGLAG